MKHTNKEGGNESIAIIINDLSLTGYCGYGMRYGHTQGHGYSYGGDYYSKDYYGRYEASDKINGYYKEK